MCNFVQTSFPPSYIKFNPNDPNYDHSNDFITTENGESGISYYIQENYLVRIGIEGLSDKSHELILAFCYEVPLPAKLTPRVLKLIEKLGEDMGLKKGSTPPSDSMTMKWAKIAFTFKENVLLKIETFNLLEQENNEIEKLKLQLSLPVSFLEADERLIMQYRQKLKFDMSLSLHYHMSLNPTKTTTLFLHKTTVGQSYVITE